MNTNDSDDEISKIIHLACQIPVTDVLVRWKCDDCCTRFSGSLKSFIEFQSGPNEDIVFNKCYFCNSVNRTVISVTGNIPIFLKDIGMADFKYACRLINPKLHSGQIGALYNQIVKTLLKQEENKKLIQIFNEIEGW